MNKVEAYERYVWPLIEKGDAYAEHQSVIELLEQVENSPQMLTVMERLLTENGHRYQSERLRVEIGGIELENPLLLAAGFDKDGRVVESMYRLGFSSMVVGTVAELPQLPNEGQIIFRPERGALINRMGFPTLGVEVVKNNLIKYKDRHYPIGLSIGINRWVPPDQAAAAYGRVAEELETAIDYWVINVSSPNTQGLRDLQQADALSEIVRAMPRGKPIFVKIAPDCSWEQVDGVIRVVLDQNLAGIVATNTSITPEIKQNLGQRWAEQAGGVSGEPIRERSNEVIAHIFRETNGRVPVMGVGGVSDLPSLLEKFENGARVVKLFTGLIYKGPALPGRLMHELDEWMEREGVAEVGELVGVMVK